MQNRHAFFVVIATLIMLPFYAFAADGTIDPIHKYAWSNMGGWVNFAPTLSTVSVTDSVLTGYVWSQNDGWINLSPSGTGVLNNGSGVLSGYAWNTSRGWISFSGVTISADGQFAGTATGDNGYVLTFDCSNCDVVTDWRSSSSPLPASSSGGSTGSRSSSAESETIISTEPTTPPTEANQGEGEPLPRGQQNTTLDLPDVPSEELPIEPEFATTLDTTQGMEPETTPPEKEITTTAHSELPRMIWFFPLALLLVIFWYIFQRRR